MARHRPAPEKPDESFLTAQQGPGGEVWRQLNSPAIAPQVRSCPKAARWARRRAPVTPTKLLIGQIVIVFEIVTRGIWFATQWAAMALGYQAELGAPWFVALERPIYRP